MSDRMLSDEELADATGYQQPSKQLEALREMGLTPLVRPDGRARITFAALTAAMTGAVKPATQRPNFSALHARR
ncbi:DUF4224 domain-containing protein [Solimonas fluminis]|uniref:DUF4224 domain-containing protein n=1 Tax=Solimonas fluminis TaxID=2086571 RepID=UPI0013FE4553|nr:DUF4224 domain-containing protein [Solimonas fluminis]